MKHSYILLSFLVGCTTTSISGENPELDGGTSVEDSGGNSSGGSGGEAIGGSAGEEIGGSGGIAGSETGGTGTGGTGPCVPKTCFTLDVEANADVCGVVSDGCGNFIDCEGCAGGFSCGEDIEGNPKENICGKVCEFKPGSATVCNESSIGTYFFGCNAKTSPPTENCELVYDSRYEESYCCANFEY